MFVPFLIILAGVLLSNVNSLSFTLQNQRSLGRQFKSKGPRLSSRLHGHTAGALQRSGASILQQNPDQRWLSVTNGLQVTTFLATCAAFMKPDMQYRWAKVNREIARGETSRLVTSQFIHSNGMHWLVNARSLFAVGQQAEKVFGPLKTLGIYLSSGTLANLATHTLNLSPHALGASGSIYGLTGAMWAYYHTNSVALGHEADAGMENIRRNIAGNLIYSFARGARIDHFGHLGGFCAGFVLGKIFTPRITRFTRRLQRGAVRL